MENVLIVLIGVLAIFGLIFLFIWHFVFGQSLRKMLMTFVGIALDRDARVDPNAPIDPDRSLRPEQELKRHGQMAQQGVFKPPESYPHIPHMPLSEEEANEVHRDTSDLGWPRQLDEETQRDPQGFRKVNLDIDTLPDDDPDK